MRFGAALFPCVALVALAVSVPAGGAHAGSITSLYNTGVGTNGAMLTDGSIDPHYTITSAPLLTAYGTSARVSTSLDAGTPSMSSATSHVIGPNTSTNTTGGLGVATGNYTYQTSFTLDSNYYSTARISATFSADDSMSSILLNGVSIGSFVSPTWNTTSTFSISSGFQAGTNTLTFVTNNTGGPAGLRIAYTSYVPEPSSLVLIASGIAGLAFARKRLRSRRAA